VAGNTIWHVFSRNGDVISITYCYIRFTLLFYFTYAYLLNVAVRSVDFFETALPRIPNLRGIKHTTPSFPNMHMLLAKFGSRIDVVQGCDETYLEGLAIGIEGNIIQSYNGLVLQRVKQAFDCGDLTTARHEQVPTSVWGVAKNLLGGQEGGPQRIPGAVPQWGSGGKAGDKYGCRLYRNTMKNTKHTNTEINTMKTRLGRNFTYNDGGTCTTPFSLDTPLTTVVYNSIIQLYQFYVSVTTTKLWSEICLFDLT